MTDKNAHSPGDSLRGHLFCQPGLTDARFASDRSQPTAAGNGAVDKPTQKATFRLSAYKGGALPGLVLHDLSIIPPAVTDRLRATRKRCSGRADSFSRCSGLAHTGPVSRRARPPYDAGQAMAGALPPTEHKLWDSGPRLTILLDPARIKPSLAAHRTASNGSGSRAGAAMLTQRQTARAARTNSAEQIPGVGQRTLHAADRNRHQERRRHPGSDRCLTRSRSLTSRTASHARAISGSFPTVWAPETGPRPSAHARGHVFRKASKSALMVSACVVGMPCGKPW
jgi:hypothetical protein